MIIKQFERIGWPTILGVGTVVSGMIVLALCMTATGTARFMAPMGYDTRVGYGVGATLELAKEVLPVAVIARWACRARGLALALGAARLCVVTFSSLATHATVVTAISSIERTGTWKMEVRTNTMTELASIEQQLGALSRPTATRPAKTVREALVTERVPPSVWQDSNECAKSVHFAKACAQVVQLRREAGIVRGLRETLAAGRGDAQDFGRGANRGNCGPAPSTAPEASISIRGCRREAPPLCFQRWRLRAGREPCNQMHISVPFDRKEQPSLTPPGRPSLPGTRADRQLRVGRNPTLPQTSSP